MNKLTEIAKANGAERLITKDGPLILTEEQLRATVNAAIASMQGEYEPVGNDLVDRLKSSNTCYNWINRQNQEAAAEIARLTKELEEARKCTLNLDVSYGVDFDSWLKSPSTKDLCMTTEAEINLAKAVWVDAERNLIKKLKAARLAAAISKIGGGE